MEAFSRMQNEHNARTDVDMDYDALSRRIEALAARGWKKSRFAEADGYPLFMLERSASSRGPAPPSLLIDAGIHGEEPASVLGLLDWLETRADRWAGSIDFAVFPCLNPWGFERGIRYDPRGRDLNRQFNKPVHPAVAGFCSAVSGRRFDLFMDLHEDCDFYGMYLYETLDTMEQSAAGATLGRTILDACRMLAPLSDGDDLGGICTHDGMVQAAITRAEIETWEEWPIALYAFVEHTHHVVTVETPGKQPLELRRALHGIALDKACEHLAGDSVKARTAT